MSSKTKAPPLRRQSSADQGKALFNLGIKSSFVVISSKQLGENKRCVDCVRKRKDITTRQNIKYDRWRMFGTTKTYCDQHIRSAQASEKLRNCSLAQARATNAVVEKRWAFVSAIYRVCAENPFGEKLLGFLQDPATGIFRDIAYNAFGNAAESWFAGHQSMFRYDESTSRLEYSAKCTVETKRCGNCHFAEVAWDCAWWNYLFDSLDPSELECHRCWELWLNCPTCYDCDGRWTPSPDFFDNCYFDFFDYWDKDCKRCKILYWDFQPEIVQVPVPALERSFAFFENKSQLRYNKSQEYHDDAYVNRNTNKQNRRSSHGSGFRGGKRGNRRQQKISKEHRSRVKGRKGIHVSRHRKARRCNKYSKTTFKSES